MEGVSKEEGSRNAVGLGLPLHKERERGVNVPNLAIEHQEREGLTQMVCHFSVGQANITQLPGDPSVVPQLCWRKHHSHWCLCSGFVFFLQKESYATDLKKDVESSKLKRTMEVAK